jgi:AcrR family transcriptional regulator
MPRKAGTLNANHQQRRAELLAALRLRLVKPDAPYPSMRELAASAGVTVTTLRHYFGRREDLIANLMAEIGSQSEIFLHWARSPTLPFAESIAEYVNFTLMGFRVGLTELHTLGLREGLRHSRMGPMYLEKLVEPTVQALEARLQMHIDLQEMRPCNVRHAALALSASLIIAFLHQSELGGDSTRPLDLDAFAADQAEAFVRAYKA